VLAQAPAVNLRRGAWPSQLIVLSAQSEAALDAMTSRLAARLQTDLDLPLADVAYTLQTGRKAFGWRRMLVSGNRGDAIAALAAPDARGTEHVLTRHSRKPHPVAFMFPGQGTQKLHMAQTLYQGIESFQSIVDTCTERLRGLAGFDLTALIYPDAVIAAEQAGQALSRTEIAQPALFVIEYALARFLIDLGVRPSAMIGHSLGEYVAACLAGVFSLDDALRLVATRGRLMQALPGGAMLAVGLDEKSLAAHLDDDVAVAAINAPQRCVVSGSDEAITRLEQRLAAQDVSYQRLAVSHAFHSPMMEPSLLAFGECVAAMPLQAPAIPFISNVSGTWITDAEATDPAYWARQLRAPVQFSTGLAALAAQPDVTLIEAGPGQTLCGLARLHAGAPIEASPKILPMLGRDRLPADFDIFLQTLGRLWLDGHGIDWGVLHGDGRGQCVSLPTYPFQRERYWLEARCSPLPQDDTEAQPGLEESETVEMNEMLFLKPRASHRQAELETNLRSMVGALLHLEAGRIDPHAPLLELGADSLVLVQAIRAIERSFGVTLTIRQLFEELTTITALAAYLDVHMPLEAEERQTEEQPILNGAAIQAPPADAAPAMGNASFPATLPQDVTPAAQPRRVTLAAGPEGTVLLLERLMNRQLDVFARMTEQQLAALRGEPAALIAEAAPSQAPVAIQKRPAALPASEELTPKGNENLSVGHDATAANGCRGDIVT
jgi:acyl transferase domain-containing protein